MAGADGGAGRSVRPGWRWDVALSFAGAQRDYVEQVAQVLQARGVHCFYVLTITKFPSQGPATIR